MGNPWSRLERVGGDGSPHGWQGWVVTGGVAAAIVAVAGLMR